MYLEHIIAAPLHQNSGEIGKSHNFQTKHSRQTKAIALDCSNELPCQHTYENNQNNKSVVEEQIDFIKNTFSLTDEKLAKILGVERKTIHNWSKSNNIPREKARARFFELYVLAKDWLSLAYPTDKMLIATPLSNDLNLLDALASLDKEKVLFIGRYLQRQSEDGNDLI